MKILCIHFKGGVGKSTTAIHTAGILQMSGKVLLIDGDRQVNSYCFFNNGHPPLNDKILILANNSAAIPLNKTYDNNKFDLGKRISEILKEKFDHFIFDTTPDPLTAGSIISQVNPDLILIPVKHGDWGGLRQLPTVLGSILKLSSIGISAKVTIVPIGISITDIRESLNEEFSNIRIANPLPYNADLFGKAVFQDFEYVWQYTDNDHLLSAYQDIIYG